MAAAQKALSAAREQYGKTDDLKIFAKSQVEMTLEFGVTFFAGQKVDKSIQSVMLHCCLPTLLLSMECESACVCGYCGCALLRGRTWV